MNSWEKLVVTLGLACPEGKHLTLEKVMPSLINEEARRKDKEEITDPKTLAIESDTH